MKIYMISLNRDIERREQIQQRFPRYYSKFQIIDAVDAREEGSAGIIQKYDKPCSRDKRRPLTKGEKCCAISHIQCLQQFLESNDPYGIVIEDDIEGHDTDFAEALSVVKNLPCGPAIVVLGGQQGMKNAKYLSGQLQDENFWEIPKNSISFLTRACCYALNRDAAEKLVKSQKSCLRRSDTWEYYFKLGIRFFYSDIFKHPIDLKNSRLESDRNIESLFSKTLSDGFVNLILRNYLKLQLSMLKLTSQLKKVTVK